MKVPNPNILIALASCLGVVALVAKDVKRSGPGVLSEVHGLVDELVGSGSCSQCHGDKNTSPDQACLACHEAIGKHIGAGKGLHGSLGSQVQRACALCHSEHHGAAAALVNVRTFLIAGVEDISKFDHEVVGYELAGAHTELECTECHVNAELVLIPEGGTRYIGLQQNCATCHEDPHDGAMLPGCADCHNQEGFDSFETFDHGESLLLEGSHGELSCLECHKPDTQYSVEALASSGKEHSGRTCTNCHSAPHSSEFLTGAEERDPEGLGCALCHVESDLAFAQEEPQLSVLLHAASGFALQDPHGDLECSQCHAPELATFELRFPGRQADQCQQCHADPHAGQFLGGQGKVMQCLDCHASTAFAPHNFTATAHAAAGFILNGAHKGIDCSKCHEDPSAGAARSFRGIGQGCNTCHEDSHAGVFQAAKDCSTCHTTVEFGDSHAQSFDHGKWTGFDLAGAHTQNRCESCHSEQPQRKGRTFGRVSHIFGEIIGCASCHKDPHGGAFASGRLPKEFAGKQGCARCHGEASFRSAADQIDHARWTGFALDGSHASVSCSACHTPLARPDAQGRTWGRAKGSSCQDCHSNPHGNQFENQGVTDCSACHSSADTFQELLFDHNRDSRFALDAAHAELACVQCHRLPKDRVDQPLQYRPLGMHCIDCHGETRRSLPGGRGK